MPSTFAGPLLHHRLWHLNRHSAAGALAVGLFCGLIPGPFQIAGAALASVALRLNLPLALLTTFYSNPLTIVPLYLAAFGLGQAVLGDGHVAFTQPPAFTFPAGFDDALDWARALGDWAYGLGKPLVCFFGNSPAERWHPWGVPYALLQKSSRDVADISVDEAIEAFDSLPISRA